MDLCSIATVGKAMSCREETSYPILRKHDVDYVLVVFGGLIGFSGDDINKFLWCVAPLFCLGRTWLSISHSVITG